MVGAHFVISSPEGPPTSPLIPPPQSWTVTTTSTTTHSLSVASLEESFAQYSPHHAATTSHKSHVPLATCSAATKNGIKNSAGTIKVKATIVVSSSRNNISKTTHTLRQASKVAAHDCRDMSTSAKLPSIFIVASAIGGQSTELGQSF